MPFVLGQTDEEKKNQGTNISGSSTSFGTNIPGQTASSGASGSSAGPKKSGQFQNINKYLQANQPQAEAMGQQVASNVDTQVGEAQQSVGGLKSNVQKVSTFDPSKTLSNLGTATDEEKSAYKTTKETGGYTGPGDISGLQDYGKAYTASQKAQQLVGQVGNEQGQQELLKQTYARPNYTGGANKLDQALLAGSAGGKAQIQSLSDKYKDLTNTFKGGFDQAGAAITSAQQAASANKAAFNPAEQAAKTSILSPIEARAQQANQAELANKAMYEDANDLNLSPETMAALGLTEGQVTYGANLRDYYNPSTMTATAGNIANAGERSKYNELMNFLGTNAGEIAQGDATFQGSSFDKDRLGRDVQTRKNDLYSEAGKISISTGGSEGNKLGTMQDLLTSGLSPDQYFDKTFAEYKEFLHLPGWQDMRASLNNKYSSYMAEHPEFSQKIGRA